MAGTGQPQPPPTEPLQGPWYPAWQFVPLHLNQSHFQAPGWAVPVPGRGVLRVGDGQSLGSLFSAVPGREQRAGTSQGTFFLAPAVQPEGTVLSSGKSQLSFEEQPLICMVWLCWGSSLWSCWQCPVQTRLAGGRAALSVSRASVPLGHSPKNMLGPALGG